MASNGRRGGNGDARYARVIQRSSRTGPRGLDRVGRITRDLARYEVGLRSDVCRHDAEIRRHNALIEKIELNLSEATDKLNVLTGHADATDRRVADTDRRIATLVRVLSKRG